MAKISSTSCSACGKKWPLKHPLVSDLFPTRWLFLMDSKFGIHHVFGFHLLHSRWNVPHSISISIYVYTLYNIYIHIFSHYNVRCHHQSKIWWDEKWTDNCHWQLKLIIFRGLIYIYYIIYTYIYWYIYMYIYIIVKYLYIMSMPNE